ncbi:MAG: hypothetical protein COU51_03875 [Parcubacteria group bacterium CG10_big_fil_rev_8_21_14_0_10_36_14]|nr:MAG: hypothetical protein COU51_03875 [Parcubacteria group bacterium CG10_big_fil_rev_8_21_14_0_10_36_14]
MDRNYLKSNHILKIDLNISKNARLFVNALLESSNEFDRQRFGEALLDELSDLAKIDIVELKISNTKQYHKRYQNKIVSKQYGYYKPNANYIFIYNRTAVQGKNLAPKTFLDTLLHEWLHHYDFKKLGLNSIHSSGFYKRLGHLKEMLGI